MTTQEAIEILKLHRFDIVAKHNCECQRSKAIGMAIRSLEAWEKLDD